MEEIFLIVLVCCAGTGLSFQAEEHHEDHTYISLGPYENSTDPNIDEGHKILLQVAKTVPGFKEELGYNWTGNEVLCNCSSSSCGSRSVVELLSKAGMKNVCVGLACYHQKRLTKINGKEQRDEHWGCFGGDRQEHDVHNLHEPFLCANTSDINVKCCQTSFCHQSIEHFPWPGESDEAKKNSNTPVLGIIMGCIAGAILLVVGVALIVKLIWKRVNRKANRFEDNVPLVNLLPSPPVFPDNRGPPAVNNETSSTYVSNCTTQGPYVPDEQMLVENGGKPEGKTRAYFDQLLKDLNLSTEMGMTTEDGQVGLIKNTYTSKMEIRETIGQGRYGSVFKCEVRGQLVAAKFINSQKEKSALREVAMYKNAMIRHTNILQFIGEDLIGVSDRCLLFEYHEFGSLDKYLSTHTVGVDTALRMIFSMATGLSFLHDSHESGDNKTQHAIAHRDLKSGNVLVKSNLMLCISDLGLAIAMINGKIGVPGENSSEQLPLKKQELVEKCGTMRYLPPELLRNKMDTEVFEAFKAADIYSMSLVMYEILRRTETPGQPVTPYEEALPYFRQIREAGGTVGDVDNAIMKQIVVDQQERPDITPWWRNNSVMSELERLTKECWLEEPTTRLTAGNVVNSIKKKADSEHIDITQT